MNNFHSMAADWLTFTGRFLNSILLMAIITLYLVGKMQYIPSEYVICSTLACYFKQNLYLWMLCPICPAAPSDRFQHFWVKGILIVMLCSFLSIPLFLSSVEHIFEQQKNHRNRRFYLLVSLILQYLFPRFPNPVVFIGLLWGHPMHLENTNMSHYSLHSINVLSYKAKYWS